MIRNSVNVLVFLVIFFAATLQASAQQATWYLLAREIGCDDLQVLVRMEKLSRVPDSPGDFAQMMRERGEQVEVGLPEGFPQEFAGKVVEVKYSNGKSPIFVTQEVCRNIEKGK